MPTHVRFAALLLAAAAAGCSLAPLDISSASSSDSSGAGSSSGAGAGGAGGGSAASTGGGPVGCGPTPDAEGAGAGFTPLWTRALGDSPYLFGSGGIAVDGQGATLIHGGFVGTLDLGAGVKLDAPLPTGYLAKLSSSGQPLWAKEVPKLTSDMIADASGAVWLNDDTDGRAVTRYDVSGAAVWTQKLATLGPIRVVPTGGGDAILSDVFLEPSLAHGAGSVLKAAGVDEDVALIKVGASGGVLWGRSLGQLVLPAAPSPDQIRNLKLLDAAPAPDGGMMVLVDLWSIPGEKELLLARLGGAGDLIWTRSFPPRSFDAHPRLATDAAGTTLLVLPIPSETSGGLGCGALGFGLGLAMIDSGGELLWIRHFPMPNAGVRASFDASGNVLITGAFMDPVDLGGGPLPSSSAGPNALRLAMVKLSASGAHLASRAIGELAGLDANPQLIGAAVDPEEKLRLAFSYHGSFDLGAGPLPDAATSITLVAQLAP